MADCGGPNSLSGASTFYNIRSGKACTILSRGQSHHRSSRRARTCRGKKRNARCSAGLPPTIEYGLTFLLTRLLAFERYDESIAAPFDWRLTRDDLDALMGKLDAAAVGLRPAL